MSAAQELVLRAVDRRPGMTAISVCQQVDGRPPSVQKSLDALRRRGLIFFSESGKYYATERGSRKLAA